MLRAGSWPRWGGLAPVLIRRPASLRRWMCLRRAILATPIGVVQEYLQQAKLPLPEYVVTALDEVPARFSCSVAFKFAGERRTFTAQGASKADAKRGAARLALDALLEHQEAQAVAC